MARQDRMQALDEGLGPMVWVVLAAVALIALGAWTLGGALVGQGVAALFNFSGGWSLVSLIAGATIAGGAGIVVGEDLVFEAVGPILRYF